MATYRLHVTAYTVTDEMELELTCTPQVLEGGSWSDAGSEGTLSIPVLDLREVTTVGELATAVKHYAAQWPPIRKLAVLARLEAIVPVGSLPANLNLGEL